jgi:hypothetical protein
MPDRRNRNKERRKNPQNYLMTDVEVAELVGVSIHTVKYWRMMGTLPFIKVGRHPKVWYSVFEKVFHKPDAEGPWELVDKSGKIPSARDIRRKQ